MRNKEIRHCKECGASSDSSRIIHNDEYGDLCSRCYQRVKSSPKTHEKPLYGEIAYTEEGKPICHICGRAYKKLMSHVRHTHEMTESEYKKEFGLNSTKGIMCEESRELARKRALENYDNSILENLLSKGEATRFQTGSGGRTKEKVREQTRIVLRENSRKYGFKKKGEAI
jgi:hypothetical protein